MPNNQEIVLNLMAKLDQGNIQSEVQGMAQSIATSLETAFESIGQRIAQQIIRGIQGGVQGGMSQVQGMAGQLVDLSGRPLTSQAPGAPALAPTISPPPTSFSMTTAPGSAINLANMPGGFAAPAAGMIPGAAAMAGLYGGAVPSRLGRALASGDVSDFGYEYGGYEGRFAEARAIVAARKSGAQIDIPDEQKAGLRDTQEAIRKTQEALVKEIIELNASIKQNNEELKKAPEEQKAAIKERIQRDMADREETRRQSERLAEGSKDIGRAMGAEGGVGMMGRIGGYAIAAQQLGGALMQMPGALRQREVALGEMGNFGARAAMSGDVERLMAAQQLGGIESVQSGSWWEQAGHTGVSALGILGGAATGALFAGPGGAIAGAGIGAANFASTLMNYSAGQRNIMEERLAAERASNPEYYAAMARARGLGMGGFQAARGLGSPEMAEFMAGGGADIDFLKNQQAALQLRVQKGGIWGIGQEGYDREQAELRDLARQAKALDPQIEAARQYTVGGQSLRGYAAGFGVGPEQLSDIMARSYGAMGGNFFGQTPQLMQNMGGMGQMARLAGLGFGQAPEVAGALVQGGMGRGEAMESTRQMFEDAVAAGFDKARVGQSMVAVASRVEQLGAGSARAAMAEQAMALGTAQEYARQTGAPGIEGELGDYMLRSQQRHMDVTRGGSGLGMLAGYGAARDIRGRLNQILKQSGQAGVQFNDIEMQRLQSMPMDEGFIQYLQQMKGVDVGKIRPQLEELISQDPSIRLKAEQQAYRAGGGTQSGAEELYRIAGGATTWGATTREISKFRGGIFRPDTGISAEDISKYGYDEALRMAQQKVSGQLDVGPGSTAAGQMAISEAQRGALQAGSGMQTLDGQAKSLATAFEQLVERTNQVFAEKGSKTAAPTPPAQPPSPRGYEGGSSWMPGRMPGRTASEIPDYLRATGTPSPPGRRR